MKNQTFVASYGRDNNLNTFGDYTLLARRRRKNPDSDKWVLQGRAVPDRELNDAERLEVLGNFFIQRAALIT